MTVDRNHTEIFDQAHKMWAEGTSIGAGEGLEPKEQDIQYLLGSEGWATDDGFPDLDRVYEYCKPAHVDDEV